jgi:hypothetical protein
MIFNRSCFVSLFRAKTRLWNANFYFYDIQTWITTYSLSSNHPRAISFLIVSLFPSLFLYVCVSICLSVRYTFYLSLVLSACLCLSFFLFISLLYHCQLSPFFFTLSIPRSHLFLFLSFFVIFSLCQTRSRQIGCCKNGISSSVWSQIIAWGRLKKFTRKTILAILTILINAFSQCVKS